MFEFSWKGIRNLRYALQLIARSNSQGRFSAIHSGGRPSFPRRDLPKGESNISFLPLLAAQPALLIIV